MGLITKTVKNKWNGSNRKHYESLGYVYSKKGEEFEVKVEHLPKGSAIKVQCRCDSCGKELSWSYHDYLKQVKEKGLTFCKKCANELYAKEKMIKTMLSSSKSFCDWCIENNRQDVLDRWDYELNNRSPKDVCYGTSKKYWFKCNKHEWHKSELKNISDFINGCEGSIECTQCKSIAQYIIDNFPNKKLEEIWDFEKNENLDPWTIKNKSNKKFWFKCQEKDYHGSYETTCVIFSSGSQCPYCTNRNGKIHPKDSLGQYIVDNYGEEFLKMIWSDKNIESPFELAPHSNKVVWWNCDNDTHEEYQRRCSQAITREFRCPHCHIMKKRENHPNWNPNITQEERENGRYIEGYDDFIKGVYERDNYNCQICGQEGNGHNLNAHHLDGYNWYKEGRTDINNGITLCKECHKEFHRLYGKGNNTKEQFEEYLKKYFKKEGI